MNLRRLGLSDIQISPMGLGCWQFSKARGMASFFWPDLPDEEIQPIVKAALEGGINWFDTAEAYGKGQSEAALSRKAERNGVMQAAKELGITIIAYSPLAQGLLTGKFHDDTGLIKQRPGPR